MSDTTTATLTRGTTTTITPTTAGDAAHDRATHLDRALNAYRLLQVHHSRVLTRQSAARGLNATDVRIMVLLSGNDRGVTPKQASEYLGLSTGATTTLVDRLVDRGYIERRPNPEDRRSILLRLTPEGVAATGEIGAVYRRAFEEAVPAELLLPLAHVLEDVAVRLGECPDADGCPESARASR